MIIKRFTVTKVLINLLVFLSTLVFVLPVKAANRNDFLFNLKDTFNSPVTAKASWASIILIVLITVIIIMIFRYYFLREEKAQRAALESYREKHRSQSSDQKRNWFRLKTDAEFKWIPAHEADTAKENQYITDQLMDISGGGLSFSTTEIINAHDEINILLPVGESKPLCLDGKIIRVVQSEDAFNVFVQFIGLMDGHRDKVVAWIQKNQRDAMYIEKHDDKASDENEEKEEKADTEAKES
ncbi:MAG: PilZ domain-containing protein [Syntrophomonadaceae bacterium]|nr:PilZ domain-containing protein [Syntrophomonadaceae bacterium]